ncbi:MAG: hypothetical protein ACR2QG_06415 [Gammaproteobacteria bacterium]
MATLAKLQEQKLELEERLADGDLSAEAALERVDKAIAARTQKIAHSQQRLAAVKDAVAKGMAKEETTPEKIKARAKKKRGPINRF